MLSPLCFQVWKWQEGQCDHGSKIGTTNLTNVAASHDFTSLNNFLFSTIPLLEEEVDPWSPSKRHSDNSCFFTAAVLFVCVLDICPIALCHLLQLLLIESLLPLLFLRSLTFFQWTENILILVRYWSDNPWVWAGLTQPRLQFEVLGDEYIHGVVYTFLPTLLKRFNICSTFSVHYNSHELHFSACSVPFQEGFPRKCTWCVLLKIISSAVPLQQKPLL